MSRRGAVRPLLQNRERSDRTQTSLRSKANLQSRPASLIRDHLILDAPSDFIGDIQKAECGRYAHGSETALVFFRVGLFIVEDNAHHQDKACRGSQEEEDHGQTRITKDPERS